MSLIEIVLIGIGLGMDAFSVSICKGLEMKEMNWKKANLIGAYFGFFQALMPILGFMCGKNLKETLNSITHIISFSILSTIGIKMIYDTIKKESHTVSDSLKFKEMIILSLATSIDALAVGVSFAILEVKILRTTLIIGIITFAMSALGVKIGNTIGKKLEYKAEILGGVILIAIGIKILIS